MDMKIRPDGRKLRVALVLQGGGALGAYQAGVYQAMHEHGLTPDWVVGTSIGAINGAIIAGNDRAECVSQLKRFWDTVAQEDLFDMRKVPDNLRRLNSTLTTLNCILNGVRGFYRPRLCSPFAAGLPVPPEHASYYDTTELQQTLQQLVDLRYLNGPGNMRLTVSAIMVTCGRLENYDNRKQNVGIEHVMASCALPPGFPPVRIDSILHWDGGLYSNTPLEIVLNDEPHVDTLCFMVDLWSAEGPEPTSIDEVQTRQKDVLFAARSRRHIDNYLRMYKLKRLARSLQAKVAPELLSEEERRALAGVGDDSTLHVVRLAYAGRDWQMALKDVNFSKGSIEWRWEQGYVDALRAIEHAAWHAEVPEGSGVVVHEVQPDMIRDVSVPL
jgi:NTE family protein